jgi:hypothetical protein
MDCTTTGAPPPMGTLPIWMVLVGLRFMLSIISFSFSNDTHLPDNPLIFILLIFSRKTKNGKPKTENGFLAAFFSQASGAFCRFGPGRFCADV